MKICAWKLDAKYKNETKMTFVGLVLTGCGRANSLWGQYVVKTNRDHG